MTDVGAVLIKLKANTMHNVATWQAALNMRKNEALDTLKAEGVFIESWFHVELEGNDYLIAYMRAEDSKLGAKVSFRLMRCIKLLNKIGKKAIKRRYWSIWKMADDLLKLILSMIFYYLRVCIESKNFTHYRLGWWNKIANTVTKCFTAKRSLCRTDQYF